MGLIEKIDDLGKPAWIALMVLSFILFWPVGLALLIYLKGSGRMFLLEALRSLEHAGRPLVP